MDNLVTNVVLVGVGGQGTILASRILGEVALGSGLEVKISEIHGMAQRGGSVVTHLRFGRQVFSPTISLGDAHFLLAFEQLEGLRWLHFLRPGGTAIINRQRIDPLPVATGQDQYPADVLPRIRRLVAEPVVVDALGEALACGQPRAANVVLLGALARSLSFPQEQWLEVLAQVVPPATVEANCHAFRRGWDT